jgi:L-asparaginase
LCCQLLDLCLRCFALSGNSTSTVFCKKPTLLLCFILIANDMIASIDHKLAMGRLAGFIIEGLVPYGSTPSQARHKLMVRAAFSGLPVAKVGRNAPEGFSDPHEFQIAASNLTATKARLLLMACLLKFGSFPPAKDPDNPTDAEVAEVKAAVAKYQTVFDTH